jgi:hypothetical protein
MPFAALITSNGHRLASAKQSNAHEVAVGADSFSMSARTHCGVQGVQQAVLLSITLGMSPAARGRAVALRVKPLAGAQRLDPEGRPSLTHIQSGRRCRLSGGAALSRARGSRALVPSRCA